MSQIHDRVMVALANTPGKQRTLAEITRFVNSHFKYTQQEVESALLDLADEKSVIHHEEIGRWAVLDGRRRGSIKYESRRDPQPQPTLVKRVNRA